MYIICNKSEHNRLFLLDTGLNKDIFENYWDIVSEEHYPDYQIIANIENITFKTEFQPIKFVNFFATFSLFDRDFRSHYLKKGIISVNKVLKKEEMKPFFEICLQNLQSDLIYFYNYDWRKKRHMKCIQTIEELPFMKG